MMVLDQLNGFRSTNPGLSRTHFSQLYLFRPWGCSANFNVLDCKQEGNNVPELAQWHQIYLSRTSQDPLFSTLIAILAKMQICPFHVLDCKCERNDGPGLAQWLKIYQSRTSQDPLLSTLMAFLDLGLTELPGNFPCPGLRVREK